MKTRNFPAKKARRQAVALSNLQNRWRQWSDVPPVVKHEMAVLMDAPFPDEARAIRTKKAR